MRIIAQEFIDKFRVAPASGLLLEPAKIKPGVDAPDFLADAVHLDATLLPHAPGNGSLPARHFFFLGGGLALRLVVSRLSVLINFAVHEKAGPGRVYGPLPVRVED